MITDVKMITDKLIEKITISDLCIAVGRKDCIDKTTGLKLGGTEPDYHFSPTLAATTFLRHLKLNLDINGRFGYWDGESWVFNDNRTIVEPMIKHICYTVTGDLVSGNHFKTLFKLIKAQIIRDREA